MSNYEIWEEARDWCRAEFRARHRERRYEHASFLASELLEEAIVKFNLPGDGVEGHSSLSGRTGRHYINVGDPYETTLYVRCTYESARFSVGDQGA